MNYRSHCLIIVFSFQFYLDSNNTDSDNIQKGKMKCCEEYGHEYIFHGKLKVHVIEARNLPNTDTAFFNIFSKDVTDPFVVCEVGPNCILKTKYINNNLNPKWDEKFDIDLCHHASELIFKVKDKDHIGGDLVGQLSITAEELASGGVITDNFELTTTNGKKIDAQLSMSIQFITKEELGEDVHELEDSYFPARESCRMIMYQDADTLSILGTQLPQFDGVSNPDGSQYQSTRAWRDLYDCLKNAQKFIYITGWSVFTDTKLLRGNLLFHANIKYVLFIGTNDRFR